MVAYTYKGYTITFNPHLPVTGQWRADWYGVGMCNNSKESIERMVDFKVHQAVESRKEH